LVIPKHTLRAVSHRSAPRHPLKTALALSLLFVHSATPAHAQAPSAIPDWLQKIPARNWAVDATAKSLENLHHEGSYIRYRVHVVDAKGDRVRDMIESRDGNVARLILRDGKPLTEEQDKAERERLTDMLGDPSGFAKHAKGDDSGKKIADQIIRLMPDAMTYTYVPGQPQTGKNPGIAEIVIDFEPNPNFHPPTTTSEALTGLRGRAWIDPKSHQILRMDGNIFKAVNLGWGMLAHIYPGGTLSYEQADLGNGRWIYTRFMERVSVRALMVKALNINTDVDSSNFRVVPAMSYQDAVHLLLDTPLPAK
jgi:hypothetical protein